MTIAAMILTVLGLCLFETVSSIDNAIINAEVLSTMQEKARRWFLIWGLFIAVFLVRGVLPWFIVWAATPGLGPIDALTATFSSDPRVTAAIQQSAPMLLVAGGTFLVFLFLHWLFLEHKNYGLFIEPFFVKRGAWFFALVSIVLAVIVWYALKLDKMMAFAAVLGSTAFFITHGFKQNAEESERDLVNRKMTDISKILYLEVIDMTFSIDGVLGAFAFTLSVPLILLGQRPGRRRGAGAHHRQHRAREKIPLPEKRRHVLHPGAGLRDAGRQLRGPHTVLGVAGVHLRGDRDILLEVGAAQPGGGGENRSGGRGEMITYNRRRRS